MADPSEYPTRVDVEECSPEVYRAYFDGQADPVYLSYEQYYNYLNGLPLNATRRHAAKKFRDVLTTPEALKEHAATRGLHFQRKSGRKTAEQRGEELSGKRYFKLRQQGKSHDEIADIEAARRQAYNAWCAERNREIDGWNRAHPHLKKKKRERPYKKTMVGADTIGKCIKNYLKHTGGGK